MKRLCVAALGLALIMPDAGRTQARVDPVSLADPFVGADAGGATAPGATRPFGFVWLSPDTTQGGTSGYDSRGLIVGFSHTHVSGTGGGSKYGNFRVTPAIGEDAFGNLAFPRSEEHASPGAYGVTIGRPGKQIRVDLTASRRVGFERFVFPPTAQAQVTLDVSAAIQLQGGGPRATMASVSVKDVRRISGSARFQGGFGSGAYTLYFAAEFDRAALQTGRWETARGRLRRIEGPGRSVGADQREDLSRGLGAFATFDTRRAPVVQLKLATSFVSEAQAERTLAAELPGWSFEAAAAAAGRSWRDALGRIEVEGGSEDQRRTFYTALYRSQTMPHDLAGENVWWRSDAPHYEDFYTLWDTFRTLHPLLTLIQPERQRDMIRSLVDTYVHTGWLPDARIAGVSGPTQGGSNADVVIADAIVKELGGFDAELAYRAMLKDADTPSPDPLNVGRELRDYLALGFMSLDQTRSASRTLEYAYDDFAVSAAAAKLGHAQDHRRLAARSLNWAHLWDDQLQCIRPRYADGRWLENFDCDREYPDQTTPWWDAPFYEGTARQYATFVPHDVHGLIVRLGGREPFVRWLDRLFDESKYTQGNEPDLLAPFLYIHAGRPDRTADRVRQIMSRAYRPARDGIPGNDDAGTMSSWYVWAAMGLFPNAGQPFYYIASPVFSRSRLHLEHGRSFVVRADGVSDANRYVQSARLNGRGLDRAWLTHQEVAEGGELALQMGPQPSNWGRIASPPAGVRP